MHRFENRDYATVHSTGNSALDGQIVEIVGIMNDFYPNPGSIYIIRTPESINSKWDTMTMIDSCLTELE